MEEPGFFSPPPQPSDLIILITILVDEITSSALTLRKLSSWTPPSLCPQVRGAVLTHCPKERWMLYSLSISVYNSDFCFVIFHSASIKKFCIITKNVVRIVIPSSSNSMSPLQDKGLSQPSQLIYINCSSIQSHPRKMPNSSLDLILCLLCFLGCHSGTLVVNQISLGEIMSHFWSYSLLVFTRWPYVAL